MEKNELFQEIKPTIWIGKRGYSETLIDEIRAQLKVRKYVKIKWLRTAEIDPEELARRAGAELVGVRGRTMVLADRSGGGRKA
ncbi:MAG TPA: YhbY family RNA-binding protein [Geoalkalibacter subterraneus]|uniref:YhbY family RNA-binding protein n=1 Tax=Geoalkalibacter subterraneus TaxID=483547 RepID=A0A831LK82_9BACT|nr:YhbY family RNA-binding protein [Geoalkalibacter subterraneus]